MKVDSRSTTGRQPTRMEDTATTAARITRWSLELLDHSQIPTTEIFTCIYTADAPGHHSLRPDVTEAASTHLSAKMDSSRSDDYYEKQLHNNRLIINNLKKQLYLTRLLNLTRQQKKKRTTRPRRWFVRDWIAERPLHGHYHQLLQQLHSTDPETYKYYLRMDKAVFDEIRSCTEEHSTCYRGFAEGFVHLSVTGRGGIEYQAGLSHNSRPTVYALSCNDRATVERLSKKSGRILQMTKTKITGRLRR